MSKIQNPILFSEHFKLNPDILMNEGLIDPFLNVDTQLFIDPVLLEKSNHQVISQDGLNAFRKHFKNFIRLLHISKNINDAAWKAAAKLLDLSEPPENGLGYGGSGTSGSSRPEKVKNAMMCTSKEIIELGSQDPEMISLMGFFEEDVGPDTISDFTTRVIINQLAQITEAFCTKNKISIEKCADISNYKLPTFIKSNGKKDYIVLVPNDIVRALPIANDWSGIEEAALKNIQIRNRVNTMLGSIASPTISDRKSALKNIALESAVSFESFLEIVKENVTFYDPNIDALGYYNLKSMLYMDANQFKQTKKYDISSDAKKILELVHETIDQFKHHVEKCNLWEELWLGNNPKKERTPQLFYYAIADVFCKANNIDINPEANMGGGPIDFKYSKGYEARVLVEMKRSSGTVVHGYEKQLEIYKDASRTNYGVFVIMDYGGLGNKLKKIQRIRQSKIDNGEQASDIIVIDAKKKVSASKRK